MRNPIKEIIISLCLKMPFLSLDSTVFHFSGEKFRLLSEKKDNFPISSFIFPEKKDNFPISDFFRFHTNVRYMKSLITSSESASDSLESQLIYHTRCSKKKKQTLLLLIGHSLRSKRKKSCKRKN